jgi:hypothetical protein
MDPEREDYGEQQGPDPRPGSPLLVFALVGVALVLAALPFLPFLCLLGSDLLGLED